MRGLPGRNVQQSVHHWQLKTALLCVSPLMPGKYVKYGKIQCNTFYHYQCFSDYTLTNYQPAVPRWSRFGCVAQVWITSKPKSLNRCKIVNYTLFRSKAGMLSLLFVNNVWQFDQSKETIRLENNTSQPTNHIINSPLQGIQVGNCNISSPAYH